VVRKDGGGWKIEVADDWQCPKWGGSSLVHSGHSGKKGKGKGLDTCYSALSVLCAQLTRDLLAIAKFLFYTTETSFPLFFFCIVNCNFPWKSFGYKADSLACCSRSAKLYYGPYCAHKNKHAISRK